MKLGKLGSCFNNISISTYGNQSFLISVSDQIIRWDPPRFCCFFLELRLNLHFFYSTSINKVLPKVIVNRLDTTKKLSWPKVIANPREDYDVLPLSDPFSFSFSLFDPPCLSFSISSIFPLFYFNFIIFNKISILWKFKFCYPY